uniref:Uncharacterized protein n=1 Tax=Globisporangium ultimum (strain ATCC 200006 / CBS 805.95 / DAOM BR144) TaxID=431595 RepID=K3WF00_GLOUD
MGHLSHQNPCPDTSRFATNPAYFVSRLASMGSSSSKERFLSAPLTPQRKFPFMVNQRFCQSRTTTITLHDNFWFKTGAEGYAIKDAFSGKKIFHVQPTLDGVVADPKTKWLVDAYKIPVAHMHETWTYTMAYNMHVGKESEYYLTQAEIKFIPLHRNPLYAEYQNPETGEKSRIGVHGDWRQRTVFIYIDRGMTGSRYAIAKVFRPEGKHVPFGSGEYSVEVVSGADVAFVVLVCAAMDDALQQSIDDPKK